MIDHVVLAVRDLDESAARLEREHGLASYAGGRHARGGTANRIVPLGSQYLELMALVEPGAAEGWGRLVAELAAEGDRPALWCLRTEGIDAVAARLGLAVEEWSRTLPDGSKLRWRLAGTEAAALEPCLPFFIEWEDPERHPARVEVPHTARPDGIAWVEVAGEPDRLREWLGDADVPVRVVPGRPAVRAFAVAMADGAFRVA
ncbi:MAG TPA: VOC family protein [Gaiellaceae bacterium]